ncbi:uncharacterized protein SCHCODRAFT_0235044 [Schizophyllum commune H4-8]|nr:uncharacterized protein SCHCODRAFT_0235044 [Schizophyllum commune H4-8]KAI5892139.1 hypothetical protein SCHCODRAFT_0235044 [Schizophyllum commune H4-8]
MQSRRRSIIVFAATTSSPRECARSRPFPTTGVLGRLHRHLHASLVYDDMLDHEDDTQAPPANTTLLPSHHHVPVALLRYDVSLVVHRRRRRAVFAPYTRLSSSGNQGTQHGRDVVGGESRPCSSALQARLMTNIAVCRGHATAPSMSLSTIVWYSSPLRTPRKGHFTFILYDPEPPEARAQYPRAWAAKVKAPFTLKTPSCRYRRFYT